MSDCARVVAVVMGIDDIADRLIGDRFHLRPDLRTILLKLIVHQNDAFAGGHHRHVSAVSDDDVEALGHLLHRQGLPRRLRPRQPHSGRDKR